MDVSIIIVNYKTPELIVECLKTVYEFTKKVSFEVIIVENAAKADDENFVKKDFPTIIWHRMGYNSGFGRANNAGMKLAKGRYFLLLNSDTKLFEPVIDTCVARMDARPDAAAGGAYQLFPDLSPRAFYHTFTFRRHFWILPNYLIFKQLLEFFIPQKQYSDPEQVDYIAAAFLMVRADAFEKTGGFDEEFFLYGEDNDFGGRLSKVGKNLLFKDCRIIHEEWGSKPERYAEAQKYTFVNRFDAQIQVSNLVWLRKQFGVGQFLLLMLHYWTLVPIFYAFKIIVNIIKFRPPFSNLENQKRFKDTISLFSQYFWRILLRKPTFYKIK